MTIITTNIDAGADSPALARVQIKEAVDFINGLAQQTGGAMIASMKSAFGATGGGSVNDSPAFAAAVAAANSATYTEYRVTAGNYLLNSNVTVGTKLVTWRFDSGAFISGAGRLEGKFLGSDPGASNGSTAYNSSPNRGAVMHLSHGSDNKPTTDGTLSSAYIQRIDQSVAGDDPTHLISALYTVHKRLAGGTGWLYGNYALVEDRSTTGAAQSVAVAGVAHSVTTGQVWGLYGEAHVHVAGSYAVGAELDTYNWTASDYDYNYADPLTGQSTKGLWLFGSGAKRNTMAVGIGSGSVATMWGAGIFMKVFSVKDYGIDIQAQPSTLINFKYGASTDGTGITPGGIGLDVGPSTVAAYGTALDQGAIHLRDQRLLFGTAGGYMQFDATSGTLDFFYNGARRGHLLLGGADHAM